MHSWFPSQFKPLMHLHQYLPFTPLATRLWIQATTTAWKPFSTETTLPTAGTSRDTWPPGDSPMESLQRTIWSKLGLKELLPAYLDGNLTGSDLLTGVSFASAGSGLDELTIDLTKAFGTRKQLDYFGEALRRIKREVGSGKKGRNLVEKALFFISVETNDMLLITMIFPGGNLSIRFLSIRISCSRSLNLSFG